jgi:hypothetical protein
MASFIDDMFHSYQANGTIFGAQDYSGSSNDDDDDDPDARRRLQEADRWREEKEERIQESKNKSAKQIAELEAKSRRKLQEQQDKSAMQRLEAEISSRLQITDKEIAGQMARLEKELSVRREDIANQLTMSRERLGFDREKLAADVQVERDRLQLAREEMERIGIPKMEADRWYQEQQVILAQEAQKIDRERIGVERGRLGLEAFSKAVELASSPASRYQFGDFAAGLAGSAEARNWFAALEDAVNQSGFGVAADAGVQPMTPQQALSSMMGFLTGQPASPVDQAAAAVAATQAPPPGAAQTADRPEPMVVGAAPVSGAASLPVDIQADRTAAAGTGFGTDIAGAPAGTAGVGAGATTPIAADGSGPDPLAGMLQQMAATNPALQSYLDRQNQELAQIGQIADAGASALAPGSLERLGENGLAEFVSGLKKLRRDSDAWLRNYQISRPSQGGGPEASWTGQ